MSRPSSSPDITELLLAWGETGDREALDRMIPLVHEELRRLARSHMRREGAGHPLQTTALVNEAYLRLIDAGRVRWKDRAHFMAVAARAMRRVLVDFARARDAGKRGGGARHVALDEALHVGEAVDVDLVALDEALGALAALDARKSQVVELRFFGGLDVEATAEALGVSPETVQRDWRFARTWLLRELGERRG